MCGAALTWHQAGLEAVAEFLYGFSLHGVILRAGCMPDCCDRWRLKDIQMGAVRSTPDAACSGCSC